MVEKSLVILCILKGRNFPRRAKYKLLVEGKFDNVAMRTDPVDHIERPLIESELAWEIDKSALQRYRLQRASLKVQFLCQSSSGGFSEVIGYAILDLRSSTSSMEENIKWYSVLHTKYVQSKPEVLMSLYVGDEKSTLGPSNGLASHNAVQQNPVKLSPAITDSLRPIFNPTTKCYQIGPINGEEPSDVFIFSVSIAMAANLVQLIPSHIPLDPAAGFFFFYSLLGCDTTTQVFYDLVNPSLQVEKTSIKLSTTLANLQLFFAQWAELEISFFCAQQILGSCSIPLQSLPSSQLNFKPACIETFYQLFPSKSLNKFKKVIIPDDHKPMVGVSIILKKENIENLPDKDSSAQVNKLVPGNRDEPINALVTENSPGNKEQVSPSSPITSSTPATAVVTSNQSKHVKINEAVDEVEEYIESFESKSFKTDNISSRNDVEEPSRSVNNVHNLNKVHNVNNVLSVQRGNLQKCITNNGMSESTHHFAFSIDLRLLSGFNISNSLNIFLKYYYQFFGVTQPITTNPPVEIKNSTEFVLPKSFCKFNFATTYGHLEETLKRQPLVVEMWNVQSSQNTWIASIIMDLSNVLEAPTKNMETKLRREWFDWLPVVSKSDGSHMGKIQVHLCFDDLGSIAVDEVTEGQQFIGKSQNNSKSSSNNNNNNNNNNINHNINAENKKMEFIEGVNIIRDTPEYKAALEIEMWRQQQMKIFETEMFEKERNMKKMLENDYKSKEREMSLLLSKQRSECEILQADLRKALDELGKREKLLASNEAELIRNKKEHQRDYERKVIELRDASQRLQDNCDHQVAMERNKLSEAEDLIKKLKQQLSESEMKYQKLIKDVDGHREKVLLRPEQNLQAEIIQLTRDKMNLERQLEASNNEKRHYKQQWARALNTIGKFKKREYNQIKEEHKKQQEELERLKIERVVEGEKEEMKKEKHELNQHWKELIKLEELHNKKDSQANLPEEDTSDEKPSDSECYEKLVREREELLETGVYNLSDAIIADFDKKISIIAARLNQRRR